jgi:predicted 3-demethylubiquinone-9 3-methyltransferase (glyoxalase superfamily)
MSDKIRICLWFDKEGEEAAKFYTSLFKNSKIGAIERYPDLDKYPEGPPPDRAGQVLTVEFELDGRPFLALNGGSEFKFTEAVSLQVDCKDQAEVDDYWEKLIANGGEESQCGWLKDKYGLSWQIIPRRLIELLQDKDTEKANRAFQAMLTMQKIDVATIERAAEGIPA